MFYADGQKLNALLEYLPQLAAKAEELIRCWKPEDPLMEMALERLIHLSLEAVTDIGALLIDGFILRDPGSYGDIVDILRDEGVFGPDRHQYLAGLVALRRMLVQEYLETDPEALLATARPLPGELTAFAEEVRMFVERENGSLIMNPLGRV